MSSQQLHTTIIAAVSACAAVVIYEIFRRVVFKPRTTRCCNNGSTAQGGSPPELGKKLRETEYTFAPDVHDVNNGSFGCVPQTVLKAQERLMEEREENPEQWYRYTAKDLFKDSIKTVAEFVGADPKNLVLVENATVAVNSIVKSFKFEDGDQILVSNHTYGANIRTVELVTILNPAVSAVTIEMPIVTTAKEIIDLHIKALDENPGIKLALIDHITSHSAIVLPIKELVEICQSRGAIAAVDGAQSPGQLPLDMEELGADFYYGNLHKWVFSPRGCAFLYIHPKHQAWIRPAISSHYTFDQDIHDRFHYTGTRDDTPFYTAKYAIQFYDYLGGLDRISNYNSELAYWAAEMLADAWKTRWVKSEPELKVPYMCLVELPQTPILADLLCHHDGGHYCCELNHDLSKHGVFVSVTTDGKRMYLRISAMVYNYREEYYLVRDAVIKVLGVEF